MEGAELARLGAAPVLRSPCIGAQSHLRTVLRDKLVIRAISRTDFFWRCRIRRTFPIMTMVITPHPLLKKAAGRLNIRVSFEFGTTGCRWVNFRSAATHWEQAPQPQPWDDATAPVLEFLFEQRLTWSPADPPRLPEPLPQGQGPRFTSKTGTLTRPSLRPHPALSPPATRDGWNSIYSPFDDNHLIQKALLAEPLDFGNRSCKTFK